MVPWRGLSSVCGRRDLPLTVQQHGPRAHESCAANAGQLFSLLIKWRIWHLSQDAPSTVSDCHTPQADVSGCAAWQISPRTGKQIFSFPPAKWLLVLFVLKKKKEFLFFCWIRYLVFSSDLFVPRKQKGLGISLLLFSTAQNTKDASSKALYNFPQRVDPMLLYITECFPGRLHLLWLLEGPSAKVWNQDYF